MEQQELKQRDWIYLLPSGETAQNMKEGCKMMSKNIGHRFGSHSFRLLVKRGVIKHIETNYLPISANSDGNFSTSPKV